MKVYAVLTSDGGLVGPVDKIRAQVVCQLTQGKIFYLQPTTLPDIAIETRETEHEENAPRSKE